MSIQITDSTVLKIVIRRGQDSERKNTVLTEGELGYTIDTQRVFVGDGITPGGKVVGNMFLGRTSSVSQYVNYAQPGDIIYDTSRSVLDAFDAGSNTFISVGNIPDGFSLLSENGNSGKWSVAPGFAGDGFNIAYSWDGTPHNISRNSLNTVQFDSRYISLCADYNSFYLGNVNNRTVTNNLCATLNVSNSIYINDPGASPNQIHLWANNPINGSSTIKAVSGNFYIAGKQNLILGANTAPAMFSNNININGSSQQITFTTSNTGTAIVPDLIFDGFSQFNNNVTLNGNLSVYGNLSYLNTDVTVTSALSVVCNDNELAALYVAQRNTTPDQIVAVFFRETSFNPILTVKDGPLVGINMTPTDTYGSTYSSKYSLVVNGGAYFNGAALASTASYVVNTGSSGNIALSSGSGEVVIQANFGAPTDSVTINGALKVTQDITAFSTSDINLKDNVVPITNPIKKLNKISGNTFTWNNKSPYNGKEDVGVIAQEVEQVIPEAVITRDDGVKAVQYDKIIPLLIECIKEQQKTIDFLLTR